MQQFFENNWLSVLSIVIGTVVAYVFYRLQKKDSISAAAERKKRATAELLDVLESYIINKQAVSGDLVDSLIHASEREHSISLHPQCTPVSLLQDVALRLQRSRHLDVQQKSEYSEKIHEIIRGLEFEKRMLDIHDPSFELEREFFKLRQLVPPSDLPNAEASLKAVAEIMRRQRGQFVRLDDAKRRALTLTTATLGATAALATALIGSKAFGDVAGGFDRIIPFIGALMAFIVGLTGFTTLSRIRRHPKPPTLDDVDPPGRD